MKLLMENFRHFIIEEKINTYIKNTNSLTEKQLATVSHRFPSYASYVIPSGTYNGIEERVNGLGIWSAVVVHKDMPSHLAYQLTCTIYDAIDELLRVSRVAEAMTISNIRKLSVPLHEGTELYLKDTSQG